VIRVAENEKVSIYIPDRKAGLLADIRRLAEEDDRSLNYMVVRAIEDYVDRRKKSAGRG